VDAGEAPKFPCKREITAIFLRFDPAGERFFLLDQGLMKKSYVEANGNYFLGTGK
jgi:hypothetical protein